MTASTDPRTGIKYGWGTGASGWGPENDANLLFLGQAGVHLSVKDRDLTAPPGGEADGDTYIPAATATEAWAGHEDDIAVWDATAGAWLFYTPRTGWVAFIEDEVKLSAFYSAAWSTGIAI